MYDPSEQSYEFTGEDLELVDRVHGLIASNPEPFRVAGARIDRLYSVDAMIERHRPPIPEEQRRAMLERVLAGEEPDAREVDHLAATLGDRDAARDLVIQANVATLSLPSRQDWEWKGRRFSESVRDLFENELPARTPSPSWEWASNVLLHFWLIADRRAETVHPHLTEFQSWCWDESEMDDLYPDEEPPYGLPRSVLSLTVGDWPKLLSAVRVALRSVDQLGTATVPSTISANAPATLGPVESEVLRSMMEHARTIEDLRLEVIALRRLNEQHKLSFESLVQSILDRKQSSRTEDGQNQKEAPPRGNAFHQDGEEWVLIHAGRTVRCKNLIGMHYLRRLLLYPHEKIGCHALSAAVPRGEQETLEVVTVGDAIEGGLRAGGSEPELDTDEQTRAECLRALERLREENREAEQAGDQVLAEQKKKQAQGIESYLSGSSRGGEIRSSGPDEEARRRVSRAISRALEGIEGRHPPLGEHLKAYVRVGAACQYSPPSDTPRWI